MFLARSSFPEVPLPSRRLDRITSAPRTAKAEACPHLKCLQGINCERTTITFLLIPRRILYLQAVLITVVAVIAFGAGYLIGKSSGQSGAAAAPNLSLDRNQATDY